MNINIMLSVFIVGLPVTNNNVKHRMLHKNVVWLNYFVYNNEKYLRVCVKSMIFCFLSTKIQFS